MKNTLEKVGKCKRKRKTGKRKRKNGESKRVNEK
jgi:hypothetical protein